MKALNLEGKTFGDLRAVDKRRTASGRTAWLCICKCGRVRIVATSSLTSGHTKSCGHIQNSLRRNWRPSPRPKHGMAGTQVYNVWSAMLQRCNNRSNPSWGDYGGRGIKVCKRWMKFENFYADMGDVPFKGAMLERKDNEGGYTPKNSVWATRRQQNRNCRRTKLLTLDGKTLCLADWAVKVGVSPSALSGRLKRGWSLRKALTAGPDNRGSHRRKGLRA